MAAHRIGQKSENVGGECFRIAERRDHTAPLRQHLRGVPVRSGNDRLAAAHRVGQGARRDLRFIAVRGHVHVGTTEELAQFLDIHEPVEELDVLRDAQSRREALERCPISFSVVFLYVGVRHAQDQVYELGVLFHDLRHGGDHVLYALIRREQPESGRNNAALHAELVLVVVGVHEREVGNAVMDERDLPLWHIVDVTQEAGGPATHHNQLRREPGDLGGHLDLIGCGLL